MCMYVCVCVCVREREKEGGKEIEKEKRRERVRVKKAHINMLNSFLPFFIIMFFFCFYLQNTVTNHSTFSQ